LQRAFETNKKTFQREKSNNRLKLRIAREGEIIYCIKSKINQNQLIITKAIP
jgi:hypothetical protein